MTYAEKLKHPLWQRKRLEIMKRDDFSCTRCGESNLSLHVHHKKYLRVENPWDYPNELLATLCYKCHKCEHDFRPIGEAKYEHLIILKKEPEVITSINDQLKQLQIKLREPLEEATMNEVLKNIMFLQNKKKELYG